MAQPRCSSLSARDASSRVFRRFSTTNIATDCRVGMRLFLLLLFVLLLDSGHVHGQALLPPCRIQVIEKGSGWPVPLVELRTTHQVRFFTDNNGVVAFDLPELMGKETWFQVNGNGYELPKDGFGN